MDAVNQQREGVGRRMGIRDGENEDTFYQKKIRMEFREVKRRGV